MIKVRVGTIDHDGLNGRDEDETPLDSDEGREGALVGAEVQSMGDTPEDVVTFVKVRMDDGRTLLLAEYEVESIDLDDPDGDLVISK